MSRVTNIILCGLNSADHLIELNNYLHTQGYSKKSSLKDITTMAGGDRRLEIDILAGAFNHLLVVPFIKFLKTINWEWQTELFIKEEDKSMGKILLSDGWRNTEPPEGWHKYYSKSVKITNP